MPSHEYFNQLAVSLNRAKHGEKGRLIEEAIRACGSRAAVYRGLKEYAGWDSKRKPRNDTGKSVISEQQAQTVMGYITVNDRKNGKQIMPLTQAVDDLKANGLLPSEVSVSTVERALKNLRIAPKQMRLPPPRSNLKSPHSNYAHQIDPSVCVLWHFGKNTRFEWMSENEFYKNKPENEEAAKNGRIWRYVLTDHASGYISVFYIQATGESFINYFDALMYFWGRKQHSPFHGLPKYLISDRIGAMRTADMQSLLNALLVEHIVAQEANAKGQVEGANNIVETSFENRLRGRTVHNIFDLNQLANQWEAWFNSTKKHNRYNGTRTDCWLRHITEQQLRNLPAPRVCRVLAEPKPSTRTVSADMAIEFAIPKLGKHRYRLRHIAGINVGDKVQVQPSLDFPDVIVTLTNADGTTSKHQVQAIQVDSLGFDVEAALIGEEFKSAPDTTRETMRKTAQKAAYGTDKQGEADKARKENKPVYQDQIDTFKSINDAPKVQHMPRRGIDAMPAAIEMPRHSPIQSMITLSNRLGRPLTEVEGKTLREKYPEGCTDQEIDDLVAKHDKPQLAAVGG